MSLPTGAGRALVHCCPSGTDSFVATTKSGVICSAVSLPGEQGCGATWGVPRGLCLCPASRDQLGLHPQPPAPPPTRTARPVSQGLTPPCRHPGAWPMKSQNWKWHFPDPLAITHRAHAVHRPRMPLLAAGYCPHAITYVSTLHDSRVHGKPLFHLAPVLMLMPLPRVQ